MMNSKIRQIIPANPGWYAKDPVFEENLVKSYLYSPIVCWALYDDDEVIGLISEDRTISPGNTCSDFVGYVYRTDFPPEAVTDKQGNIEVLKSIEDKE